jgi:hypothetical protein
VTPAPALLGICLGALALRLAVLGWVRHPGIADPNHYYNLALRLLDGHGFTIDYIWQYYLPPAGLVHPIDHWMPLAGLLAAASMALLGPSVPAATIPFVVVGSALPALAYAAARRLGSTAPGSLFCAAAAAVLPELVLNSVRTDTTIVNAFLACTAILLFARGLTGAGALSFAGSGVAAGLAYLTRHDAVLLVPVLLATLLVHRPPGAGWRALLTPLFALLTTSPWLLRNLSVLGRVTVPGAAKTLFYTDPGDHFAYGREFTLQAMLASQTLAQLAGKRLFELGAAVKVAYTSLDVLLPVAVAGGLALLLVERRRERWGELLPVLGYLLAILVAYPLLAPFHSQNGSFKKAYLSVIPLLLPWAAHAIERAVPDRRMRLGVMALGIAVTGANAVELVRADARFTNAYLDHMARVAAAARDLPDENGDGAVVLMAQDPFMLRFLGVRSLMIPYESRETILAVAGRYGADYLLMPADRPALDPIQHGLEADARFRRVRILPGTTSELYRLEASP